MASGRSAAIAESWKRTLEGIPSTIGRLAYLASLRNAITGAYEHTGLAERLGHQEADRLLQSSHESTFGEWLHFELTQQKEELEEYLGSLEGDHSGILAHWLRVEPYMVWIPRDCTAPERELFQTDLAMVLELIRKDLAKQGGAGAFRDPKSLQAR